MAGFCSKCGAPLASTSGFCPSCGTPVAAAAAPAAAAGYAEVALPQAAPATYTPPPAQAYAQPPTAGYPPAAAYPAPAKSGGAGKVVLIVVAVVGVLFVIVAGIVGYGYYRVSKAIHSVHVDANGDGGSVTIPGGGTITAGNSPVSSVALGVPVYPGALQGKGNMSMNLGAASTTIAHYSTPDSISQVVDFYKDKMGEGTVTMPSGNNGGTVLNSGGKDTDRIMVTVGPGSGADEGKTTIVIMHTKKNE